MKVPSVGLTVVIGTQPPEYLGAYTDRYRAVVEALRAIAGRSLATRVDRHPHAG